MNGRLSGGMGVIIVWTLIVFGAMYGLNVGYNADSPNQANITFNGTHIIEGNNASRINYSTNQTQSDQLQFGIVQYEPPNLLPEDVTEGFTSQVTESMIATSFTLAIGVADATATIGYHVQWLPEWLLSGVLQIAIIVPYLFAGGYALKRVQALRREYEH